MPVRMRKAASAWSLCWSSSMFTLYGHCIFFTIWIRFGRKFSSSMIGSSFTLLFFPAIATTIYNSYFIL